MIEYKENSPRHYMIISGILIVFCLLFMILFRIEPVQKDTDETDDDLDLFFMVPDRHASSKTALEQAQKDNLDLVEMEVRDSFDDPTIMSHPNRKYGFSKARNENDEPPPPAVNGYDLPLMRVVQPEEERIPLVGIFPDPVQDSLGNFKPPAMPPVKVAEVNETYSLRVIWIEDGKEIASPVKEEEVKKAAAGKMPTSVTEIRIEKLSSSPVQFLVKKCGITALDKLALDHFNQLFTKVFTGQLKADALPNTILIDWRLILREDIKP